MTHPVPPSEVSVESILDLAALAGGAAQSTTSKTETTMASQPPSVYSDISEDDENRPRTTTEIAEADGAQQDESGEVVTRLMSWQAREVSAQEKEARTELLRQGTLVDPDSDC